MISGIEQREAPSLDLDFQTQLWPQLYLRLEEVEKIVNEVLTFLVAQASSLNRTQSTPSSFLGRRVSSVAASAVLSPRKAEERATY